ncbi:MAG TPA: hypothetical protein VM120_14085 [Bryobacteraceae bacterium]|nr:hypothetical protein [Bryobacteraceae bacterium]
MRSLFRSPALWVAAVTVCTALANPVTSVPSVEEGPLWNQVNTAVVPDPDLIVVTAAAPAPACLPDTILSLDAAPKCPASTAPVSFASSKPDAEPADSGPWAVWFAATLLVLGTLAAVATFLQWFLASRSVVIRH